MSRFRPANDYNSGSATIFESDQVIIHPDFDGTNNDIALIHLSTPAPGFFTTPLPLAVWPEACAAGTQYYWKVTAIDARGLETESSAWSFTTQ
ncbi:MAG: trypsin-like serine protease [Spirochaetales bacterium]|nr:trypsin-like serine protease [Spirochaetales bacterium]